MTTSPDRTLDTLRRHVLLDGFDLVLDLDRSSGSTLVDARTGTDYLDLLTFFGSLPLGMNHPGMAGDGDFMAALARAALHKVSNSDIYTPQYAGFAEAFARVLGDPDLPHLFFIDGGALAVENALKAAFDWKAQRTGDATGLAVMHLANAFHGRSGYTLSLTGTDPAVTDRYPAWDWPRISLPEPGAQEKALDEVRRRFAADASRIACFIAEPIQGAGGDVHLSAAFLQGVQNLCHRHDVLFVMDEVQTGCGMSGTPWTYQQLGLAPDIVVFGKKTQVSGVMAGRRIERVRDNAFTVSSRLGSTWGGNTVDMVRATRIFEIIERDRLIPAAAAKGAHLLALLEELRRAHPGLVRNVRGRGLMCAFDLPTAPLRSAFIRRLREEWRVLLLPGGERGVRFRPSLAVGLDDLDKGVAAVDSLLASGFDAGVPGPGARGRTPS